MTTLQPAILPQDPDTRAASARAERSLWRQSVLASALVHLLVRLCLLAGLVKQPELAPVPVLRVALVPGPGAEGAAGGTNGSGQSDKPQGGAEAAPSTTNPNEKPNEAVEATAPAPETPVQPPVPPTPPLPEPAAPPTPVPTISTPVLPPKPAPKPPAHRKPKVLPKAETVPQTVAPAPIPGPSPAPLPPKSTPGPEDFTRPGVPGAGAGPGGTEGQGKGDTGKGGGAGGDRGVGNDYLDRLQRYLRPFLRYPKEAMRQNQRGTVWVGFTVARDGTVSNLRVEQSSGFPLLDEAALDTIRRAVPLLPLPDTLHSDTMNTAIPVEFKLGLVDQLF
jgi:protein TonB